MKELENKIDKILETQISHGQILAVQTAQLAEHMKRSDLLEKKIEIEVEKIETAMTPLADHVNGVRFTVKVVGGFLGIIATTLGILKYFEVF